MVRRRPVYIYFLNVPSFSSRYFNKIKRTSRLGRLLALSLEILLHKHVALYQLTIACIQNVVMIPLSETCQTVLEQVKSVCKTLTGNCQKSWTAYLFIKDNGIFSTLILCKRITSTPRVLYCKHCIFIYLDEYPTKL